MVYGFRFQVSGFGFWVLSSGCLGLDKGFQIYA